MLKRAVLHVLSLISDLFAQVWFQLRTSVVSFSFASWSALLYCALCP